MLDWVTGIISCDASRLKTDVVCRVEPTGHILWESGCWLEVKGSYESAIQLRQSNRISEVEQIGLAHELLQLSGNPVKFLQGHNAFGPSVILWQPVVEACLKHLPDSVRPLDLGQGPLGMWPSRIDIAIPIDMGSYENVKDWLRCVATGSRSRHGRAQLSGDTVYWGQHSRRWSLKGYGKFDEMGVHPGADLKLNDQLRESIRSVLRLELTLRGLELKDLKRKGMALTESLVWDYLDKVSLGRVSINRVKGLECLSLAQQAVFMRWAKGESMTSVFSETQQRKFYRYRRAILDTMGVDISIVCQDQESFLERMQFDVGYLREHEIKVIPDVFKDRIFQPESFELGMS